jgi:peptide/nickel transport system permease protein
VKFVLLPVVIGFLAASRECPLRPTVFLEEINRTTSARAGEGAGRGAVLFRHALKNAMIPILTSVVVTIRS